MNSQHSLPLVLLTLLCPLARGADDGPPANSELVVNESFDSPLDDHWHVNTGKWSVADGVLRARELESDQHVAAARRTIETQNAVYQLRFRLVENGESFHFGFDPTPGELKKRGHLFSVIVTPKMWKVMKHIDKDRPQDDPNETLAEQATPFVKDQWYTLRVTTWGNYVTARIDGKETLKVSHESFGVKKPTLVFRCVGDGVEIDDIKVWRPTKK